MLKFYYHPSPNPAKAALFLEEAGLPYELVPVDTRRGEQFAASFVAVNPNAKTPAIVDGDVTLFDSNAILLYLAEKTGTFLPPDTPAARAQMLSWLMFVASGIGPFTGQALHFRHLAPEKLPYAIDRYVYETERHWGIVDRRLAAGPYMMGDDYTIVDMAVWGWVRVVPAVLGEAALATWPNLKRHHDEISARPAAVRADALKDRHDFKTDMDEEARAHLFPQDKPRPR